jgi:hypothetical protein
LELTGELAAKCSIKGIAYTGYGFEADTASAKAAGFSAPLLKPVDLKKMLETVETVLKA